MSLGIIQNIDGFSKIESKLINEMKKTKEGNVQSIKCPSTASCGFVTYTENDLKWTKKGRVLICPKCHKKMTLHKMVISNKIGNELGKKEGN